MTSPVPPRTRAAWDIVLSIVFLVVAMVGALVAAFAQFFIFAFTDYCPPATCHLDEAVGGVFVVWFLIGAVILAAIVLTIVFLVKRRRAWWIGLSAIGAVIIGAIVGFVVYYSAVG